MRKLILSIAMLATLCSQAHTPEFSMYKSVEKKSLSQKLFKSEKKVTGKLLVAAGGFIILGGITQGISAGMEAPVYDVTKMDYETWNNKYTQWKKDQVTFKLTSAGLFTLGGVFLLFVGDDILTSKIAENQTASLKFKASPTSVGLCLNFK